VGKIAMVPVLMVAACLVAGLYGSAHNQISYTVSPDYFHAYKFIQFDIPEHLRNRVGAGIVGWHASWWMGILIGCPVLCVGLMLPDRRTYVTRCLRAFGIVAGTALVVGLAALVCACFTITEADPNWQYPDGVTDKVAFDRAGTMHYFSYLGGFLGILTATVYLIVARVRLAGDRNLPRPG
jgi:hypothetical protein